MAYVDNLNDLKKYINVRPWAKKQQNLNLKHNKNNETCNVSRLFKFCSSIFQTHFCSSVSDQVHHWGANASHAKNSRKEV